MNHVARAWKLAPLKGAQLIVLLALADCSDRDGRCEMTVAELAKKARISCDQVECIVRELTNAGILEVFPCPDDPARLFWLRFPDNNDTGGRG